MSIRKFNVNKTESSIALASTLFPGFMSREDKIALDTLVAANFAGGSISSVTINMTGIDEVKDRLTALESSVATLQAFVNQFSSTNNLTYGIKNGKPEEICGADESVIVCTNENALSLSLASLESGKLEIDETTEPEIVEEMRNLLGDELFNELATKSVSTLELQPQLSDEEQIRRAKEEYFKRKIEEDMFSNFAQNEDMNQETGSLDVIKKKGETE